MSNMIHMVLCLVLLGPGVIYLKMLIFYIAQIYICCRSNVFWPNIKFSSLLYYLLLYKFNYYKPAFDLEFKTKLLPRTNDQLCTVSKCKDSLQLPFLTLYFPFLIQRCNSFWRGEGSKPPIRNLTVFIIHSMI